MESDAAQLDLFRVGEQLSGGTTISELTQPNTCLRPEGSIRECRECWECNPELWPRYYTRANCVKHNR